MKRAIIKLLLILLPFGVASCSVTSGANPSDYYVVRVAKTDDGITQFRNMALDITENQLILIGKLEYHGQISITGHIDIVVWSPEGKILEQTTTHYLSSLNSLRVQRRGGAPFKKVFAFLPPKGSEVVVAFHKDGHGPHPDSQHVKNVALEKDPAK